MVRNRRCRVGIEVIERNYILESKSGVIAEIEGEENYPILHEPRIFPRLGFQQICSISINY